MKSKLILILILIILLIILDVSSPWDPTHLRRSGYRRYINNKEKFNEETLVDWIPSNIIITSDEDYYYINIEDKSDTQEIFHDNQKLSETYTLKKSSKNKNNINYKNNKWLPKKYNIIKIRLK
jgi:hypothetical protein